MPRACPVEPHEFCYLAGNVKLHGTRPWHPQIPLFRSYSGKHETPRDKPVVSKQFDQGFSATLCCRRR
jgi:hypothetical protein